LAGGSSRQLRDGQARRLPVVDSAFYVLGLDVGRAVQDFQGIAATVPAATGRSDPFLLPGRTGLFLIYFCAALIILPKRAESLAKRVFDLHLRFGQKMSAIHSMGRAHRSALQQLARATPVQPPVDESRNQPAFVVTLSPQAAQSPAAQPSPPLLPPSSQTDEPAAETEDLPFEKKAAADEDPPAKAVVGSSGLTTDQQAMVIELAQRDRAVHSHEAAHQAAGGGLVGAASYSYQVGPDGRSYAIGGECPIQMSGGQTPAETISIAQRVRSAALAPANPSSQDLAVANAAAQMEMQARAAASQAQAPSAKPQGEPKPNPPPEPGTPVHDTDVQLMTAQPDQANPSTAASARRAVNAYGQLAL
jgi:hypothetical protein